ncbi:MAG: biotin transporter BioY [Planctomycetota bacterium]
MSISRSIGMVRVRPAWDIEVPALLARVLGVIFSVVLMGLGAHVKFFLPGNPVPVTLQTFFVLLAGALLGARAGVAAVALYITLGVAGLPMFAGAGAAGVAYLLGPTGGYLAGFLVAAALVGGLARRVKSLLGLALVFVVAEIVLLLMGALHLSLWLRLGVGKGFALGFVPFLYGDVVKAAAAFVLFILLDRRR